MKKKNFKKGIIAVALGMVMMLVGNESVKAATLTQLAIANQLSDENKTEAYLVITTLAEFKEFAANAGVYDGKLVQLGNNIKFDGTINNYTPIERFNGIFDGCGYTISGIDVTDCNGKVGLFAKMESGAIVRNVTLENCEFSNAGRYAYYAGGIAGLNDGGRIVNCNVINAKISNAPNGCSNECYAGGIVGLNNGGTIINGHVRNTTINGMDDGHYGIAAGSYSGYYSYYGRTGGITGGYGTVVSCSSNATVTGHAYAGGISGYGGTIENCYNYGTVSATCTESSYGFAGGVAGYTGGTVQNCYNVGTVTGNCVGGVVASSGGIVANCYCTDDYMIVAKQNTIKNNKQYSLSQMQSADFLNLLNNNCGDNAEFFHWEFGNGYSYPQHVEVTSIENYTLTLGAEVYTYNGSVCTPPVTVSNGSDVLVQDEDYEVIYANNKNAGTGTVMVTGIGMYNGDLKKEFVIQKANSVITYTNSYSKHETDYSFYLDAELTAGVGELTYQSDNTSVVQVDEDGYVRIKGVGSANITISVDGDDNYNAASVVTTVTVSPKPLDPIGDCTVTLSSETYTYNGYECKPSVTVKDGRYTLKKDQDYTVTYSNNINAGVATVIVSGKGEYGGEVCLNYNIKKADAVISNAYSKTKTYGNKAFSLGAILTSGEVGLTYVSSNPEVATLDASGKVTIKGVGVTSITVTAPESKNYNATTKTITITVKPKTVKLKLSVSGKKLKMKWNRDKRVNGYQVQYALDQYFSKSCKTKTIKKNSKVSYTGKTMKKKTYYYARIRSYKNVTVNGKKKVVYGDWSKVVKKMRK